MAKSSRREKGAGKEGGTGQRRGVDRTRRTGKEGKGDGTEWAGEGKIRKLDGYNSVDDNTGVSSFV